MDFPISGQHINPLYLATLGFVVGIFGGFFGVGGSFLAGPGLFVAGLPMNWVVGTDLAHIVGKSIVAMRGHLVRGNVDMKLGLIMAGGTIIGTEAGAQVIQHLKQLKLVNVVVGVVFIAVLVSISAFMAWESWATITGKRTRAQKRKHKDDESAVSGFSDRIHRIKLWPMIKLAESEIKGISLWTVLIVAMVGGLFAGFLGGGAGYVRMPLLVYVLGVPTKVAVGTDLFEVVISSSYGTISHAIKGNVDIMIALVMHTGAAVGAQIGVVLTQFFRGPRIRLAFSPLPFIGAVLIVYGLITGHQMK
jgi:uncharacterized membrane protein YfcA